MRRGRGISGRKIAWGGEKNILGMKILKCIYTSEEYPGIVEKNILGMKIV